VHHCWANYHASWHLVREKPSDFGLQKWLYLLIQRIVQTHTVGVDVPG